MISKSNFGNATVCILACGMFVSCLKRGYNARLDGQGPEPIAEKNASGTQESAPAPVPQLARGKPVLSLLQENSQESRQTIAQNIEREFVDVVKSVDPNAAAMRVAVNSAVTALRNGADTLCSEAEKTTVYRGINDSSSTKNGDAILVSSGVAAGATSLRGVADAITGGKSASFEAHAQKMFEKSAMGAFVWATLKPKIAAVASEKIVQIRVCPQRLLSVLNDPNLDGRVAIFGAVLPEEISQVSPASDAEVAIASPLAQCFESLPKTGNFAFVRDASRALMAAHSDRMVRNAIAQIQGAKHESWLGLELQTIGLCTCAGIVKRANEAAFAATQSAVPMWKESEVCPKEE